MFLGWCWRGNPLTVSRACLSSVVAVHGLGGDPYRSWIGIRASQKGSPRVDVDWLKDLLPEFAPRCRILSFGYQSRYMKNAPKRDISNCAEELLHALQNNRAASKANKRPLIFICHSLGGIVVKEVRLGPISTHLSALWFDMSRVNADVVLAKGTN